MVSLVIIESLKQSPSYPYECRTTYQYCMYIPSDTETEPPLSNEWQFFGIFKDGHFYPAIAIAIIFYGIKNANNNFNNINMYWVYIPSQVLKSMAVRFVMSIPHLNQSQARHYSTTRLYKKKKSITRLPFLLIDPLLSSSKHFDINVDKFIFETIYSFSENLKCCWLHFSSYSKQ